MKTAIVHEWLTNITGSEKVVQYIYEIYPSPIYVLVKDESAIKGTFFEGKDIKTSFIQSLPFSKKHYRSYLFLFPLAIEQFDLREYDIVLSSSHAVAKGVLTSADQLHITYCHTPMRYAWDLYFDYLEQAGLTRGLKALLVKRILHNLRKFDYISSARPDYYIANSRFIARRIKKIYRREAHVIYPPVEVEKFRISENREDYYLVISRLVPYKRVDLVIEAFNRLKGRKLLIIGDGPDMPKLKRIASRNIEFLGYQEEEKLRDYLSKAKALIHPQIEDFGIVPVEAMASGVPVIAYGRGGVLETVIDGKTGKFFKEQSVKAIIGAIKEFEEEEGSFDPEFIRQHAMKFNVQRFKREYKDFVEKAKEKFFREKGG